LVRERLFAASLTYFYLKEFQHNVSIYLSRYTYFIYLSKRPFLFLLNFPSPRGALTHFCGEIQLGGLEVTLFEYFSTLQVSPLQLRNLERCTEAFGW